MGPPRKKATRKKASGSRRTRKRPTKRSKSREVATPDIVELFASLDVQSLSGPAQAAVAVRCAERALAALPDHPSLRVDRPAVVRAVEVSRRYVTDELRTFDREVWDAFAAASNAVQQLRDVQGGMSSIFLVCSDAIGASLPASLANQTSMIRARCAADLWIRLVVAPLQARSSGESSFVEAAIAALADDVSWLRALAPSFVPRAFFDRPLWPSREPVALEGALESLRAELLDLNHRVDPAAVFEAAGLDAGSRAVIEESAPEELEQLVGFDASGKRTRLPGLTFWVAGPPGPGLLDLLGTATCAEDLLAGLTTRPDAAAAVLPRLVRELEPRGLLVFVAEREDARAQVAVLRSADRFDALRARGTSAPNFDLGTEELIARLQGLEPKLSFAIRGASSAWVELVVTRPPDDPVGVAAELYALCPDVVEQGFESVDALAQSLAACAPLTLWWD